MSSIAHRRKHARRESGPAYQERRKRLLSGAAEVFKEKGFQAASINDIAERFGGDRASIYYYYGSKHEIFIELIEQAVTEVVELAELVANSAESATTRLAQLLATTMDAYERHYPYMYVYIQEDMRKVPGDGSDAGVHLQALSDRFEAALRRIVDDGKRNGEIRADVDAGMLIFAFSGALNWTHRWFAPGGRLNGAEVGAMFADIFLRGTVPAAAAAVLGPPAAEALVVHLPSPEPSEGTPSADAAVDADGVAPAESTTNGAEPAPAKAPRRKSTRKPVS